MGKEKGSDGLEWSLTEEDLSSTLLRHEGSPLLFGVVESERVLRDLEEEGILARLRERGYHDFRADDRTHVQHQARFQLLAQHQNDRTQHVLFDIRTHRSEISWDGGRVPVLFWDWLEFQDPKGRFQDDRPPLPGQDHPGLGVFKAGTELIRRYVEETRVDAIVAVPEYFHNAWLYSRSFCFYEPRHEGEFRALVRDLLPAGLARASHAVKDGEVVDQTGAVFEWKPHHQVCPLSRSTRAHFETAEYKKTVTAFLESTHFQLNGSKE